MSAQPDVTLFDTHAHLDFPDMRADLDAVLGAAAAEGVRRIVTIGGSDGIDSNWRALEIARANQGVWCSAGIHPHDAGGDVDTWLPVVADELAELPEVVAIGEAGLDYYYDKAPRERQRRVFATQLELSKAVGKPIVIHSRDAEDDTLEVLDACGYTGGILHCFTGSRPFAEALLERGFTISFSGIVTFKNGKELLEIARDVPADRILVETDSPFLAPVPRRGKPNRPAYVRHTAARIAEIRGEPLADFAAQTYANACRIFGLEEAEETLA
jgi:TatD DNase family protein